MARPKQTSGAGIIGAKLSSFMVMAGLVPATHVEQQRIRFRQRRRGPGVGDRDKPGHDDRLVAPLVNYGTNTVMARAADRRTDDWVQRLASAIALCRGWRRNGLALLLGLAAAA